MLLGGGWRPSRWLAWWVGLAAVLTLALLVRPGLGAKLAALAAGVAYPTLAGRWAWLQLLEQPPRSRWAAVAVLWQAAGWAVLGGLLAQALLASARYMLGQDIFSGVKLTQVLPIAAILALVGLGLTQPGVDAATVRERWRGFWSSPVRFLHAVVLVAGLAAVAILLVRSGNEGANVPEAELKLRALLETMLGARPRTKEFLCGDPALLLAALAAWRGRREWVGPLLVVGMIGLASTLNTFCHIHTPLSQSLLRTFHALWIATLLGLAVDAWLHRRKPAEQTGG
ncbi:MAG: hypothetical protein HYU66_26495 [Armatimonadetes bacterium]|nr:hypothetical protein [Armatimonadota bacterium]